MYVCVFCWLVIIGEQKQARSRQAAVVAVVAAVTVAAVAAVRRLHSFMYT